MKGELPSHWVRAPGHTFMHDSQWERQAGVGMDKLLECTV